MLYVQKPSLFKLQFSPHDIKSVPLLEKLLLENLSDYFSSHVFKLLNVSNSGEFFFS